MSELSLNEQSFIAKCGECKESLLSLSESFNRNAAFAINNNQDVFHSESVDTLGRAYCLLFNTILQGATTMFEDWNIIEACGLEIATFDRYLGSCIVTSNASPYYYQACNDIWNSRNAYDVSFSSRPIDESLFPNYRSATDWVVFDGNIQALESMKQYLDDFIPSCDNYQNLLNDFINGDSINGQLGDTIRNYLTRVHIELINYIRIVAEQLKDAINQYCILYSCNFPEDRYLLNKSELLDDVSGLGIIAQRYCNLVSRVRNTINTARNELRGNGLTYSYSPVSVSSRQPNNFEYELYTAIQMIREVINIVDDIEERGRYLANDAENDILRLRATIDYIQPMGGHRVLHYRNDDATNLLDIPNVEDDVTVIEREEPVFNSEVEYYLSGVRDADEDNLPDAINATREYFSSLLSEDITITDEMVINSTEYYYHLIDEGWNSDQALAIVLYSISDFSDELTEGDYSELDNSAATTCPEPSVVRENAVNFAMRIANDPAHGYDQDTRTSGVDYDCSSLVMSAYIAAGAPGLETWATGGMRSNLTNCGFEIVGDTSISRVPIDDLRPGDILLTTEHTEIYVGNGYTVSASIDMSGTFHNNGQENGDQRMYIETIENDETLDYETFIEPDIYYPSTLDTGGEIRFENVDRGGYLESEGWVVYRYTGV